METHINRDDFVKEIANWYRSFLSNRAVPDDRSSITQSPVCYHALNIRVDDWIAQCRSEHRNPRVELLPPPSDDPDAQDLLEPNDKEMPHLDSLLAALRDAEPLLDDQVAIAAVALAGGHCARMDSNATAAASVWAWSDSAAGEGWKPEDIAPLRVIQFFAATAEVRVDGADSFSFTLKQIDDIAAESRAQLHLADRPEDCDPCDDAQKEALKRHRRVLAHLTETIASLPATLLRKETSGNGYTARYGEWVERQALDWFPKDHGLAVFHQHNARILLALGDHNRARHEVEQALARAKPHMLQSIEASRQMQLAIDLENLSREDITREVTETVTKKATEKIVKESHELQDNLLGEMRKLADEERNKTASEIKDALLRVVEILGVFLAIAAIGVTAVGGIAVEEELWVRIGIWAFGYLSFVSLFWLLRRITGGSSIRQALRAYRGLGHSEPKAKSP